MKRLFMYILFATTVLVSCNNEPELEEVPELNISNDEYYIKYIISRVGSYPASNPTIYITNEYGESYDVGTSSFNGVTKIIGPVKRGFCANISSSAKMHMSIECCKNNSPFAEKAKTPKDGGTKLAYIIDY